MFRPCFMQVYCCSYNLLVCFTGRLNFFFAEPFLALHQLALCTLLIRRFIGACMQYLCLLLVLTCVMPSFAQGPDGYISFGPTKYAKDIFVTRDELGALHINGDLPISLA